MYSGPKLVYCGIKSFTRMLRHLCEPEKWHFLPLCLEGQNTICIWQLSVSGLKKQNGTKLVHILGERSFIHPSLEWWGNNGGLCCQSLALFWSLCNANEAVNQSGHTHSPQYILNQPEHFFSNRCGPEKHLWSLKKKKSFWHHYMHTHA